MKKWYKTSLLLAAISFHTATTNSLFAQSETTDANQIATVSQQHVIPTSKIIDSAVIAEIKRFVNTDIVRLSIQNQNLKYGNLEQERINQLDKQWRSETSADDQPLIAATLSNPLSSYLTRIQAHSIGLYSEMFVMDKNGLNVGQSNISSDYWQGDEAKFKKTYPKGSSAIFIDAAEFDDKLGIWRAQVNLSIADKENNVIGAITVELNLSELQRRQKL